VAGLAQGVLLAQGADLQLRWRRPEKIARTRNYVIQRYREVTFRCDYFGDSVLNFRLRHFCHALLGFYLARRCPLPPRFINWVLVF